MYYQFSFEKLNVWHDSKEFIKFIYEITNHFPETEKFGLISKIRRASISVASNLAEGNSRITSKDKAHFTTLSFSSLMEVLNQLIIAKELAFINEEEYKKARDYVGKISNKLNALRKSQLTNYSINQ